MSKFLRTILLILLFWFLIDILLTLKSIEIQLYYQNELMISDCCYHEYEPI